MRGARIALPNCAMQRGGKRRCKSQAARRRCRGASLIGSRGQAWASLAICAAMVIGPGRVSTIGDGRPSRSLVRIVLPCHSPPTFWSHRLFLGECARGRASLSHRGGLIPCLLGRAGLRAGFLGIATDHSGDCGDACRLRSCAAEFDEVAHLLPHSAPIVVACSG